MRIRSRLLMSAMSGSSSRRPPLKGVVFDMDGTLTIPNLDFGLMYDRCGVARDEDILEVVERMAPSDAARARGIIEEMEEEGRRTLRLMPGATEVAAWLGRHGLKTAIVTRNTRKTVDHLHAALWEPAGLARFAPAVTRDDAGVAPKPDPEALEAIAEAWGFGRDEIVMVGDSPSNDVVFGKAANVGTALLDTGRRFGEGGGTRGADLVVASLAELPAALVRAYDLPGAGPLKKYPAPEPTGAASLAAVAGDVDALVVDGAALDAPDASGNAPLVWAADAGRGDAVAALLAAGADKDARGYLGATAVCRAARRGHDDVLAALLDAGADPDVPNDKMQSPLHFAAFKKNPTAVDLLLKHGASTLTLDRKGRTPAEDTSDADIRSAILAARADRPAESACA